MAHKKADFDAVRKIGLDWAGVEEATSFGQPALKIGGRVFACMASHKSAEPGSLVARVDLARREELLAEAPDVYYITEHYAGYTGVLARLSRIRPDELRGLLAGAIEFIRGDKKRAARRRTALE